MLFKTHTAASSSLRRDGFTVVELFVCMAVIGVLLGLLLPAVQRARESARRTDCRNRLRQIGLASHAFHDARNSFPKVWNHYYDLLPYLEQKNLHAALAPDPITGRRDRKKGSGSPNVYACPSSDVILPRYEVSFVRNAGTRIDPYYLGGATNGTLTANWDNGAPIRFADITDGTSNTAFWSETKPWSYRTRRQPEPEVRLSFRQIQTEPHTVRELQQACLNAAGRARAAGLFHTLFSHDIYYQHINQPNTLPCVWDVPVRSGRASRPASSWHTGGINVLKVDGSVHFVSEVVDEFVWRKMGSRNSDDDIDQVFRQAN